MKNGISLLLPLFFTLFLSQHSLAVEKVSQKKSDIKAVAAPATATKLPGNTSTVHQVPDVTAIWRGFTHVWVGEVHRAGVLGNWIKLKDQTTQPRDFSAHHWAQSGTAKDSASFSSRYSLLEANDTRFIPGKIEQPVWIVEGTEESFSNEVVIPKTSQNMLIDKEVFDVVINGFRIEKRSTWEAKKLGILEIELTQPIVTRSKVKFHVNGRFMASCKSFECDVGIKKGEYNIVVHYNLIAAKTGQFNAVHHNTLIRDYSYDSKIGSFNEEAGQLGGEKLKPVPPYSNYAVNVTGIRKFRFHASKNASLGAPDTVPHLLKWKMWINHVSTSGPDAGVLKGMAYFEHRKNIPRNAGHIGHARIEIDPVTLQFKSGDSVACSWSQTKTFGNSKSGKYKYSNSGVIAQSKLSCP